jgi:hypothetical protein
MSQEKQIEQAVARALRQNRIMAPTSSAENALRRIAERHKNKKPSRRAGRAEDTDVR